jgi:hypothetical protein
MQMKRFVVPRTTLTVAGAMYIAMAALGFGLSLSRGVVRGWDQAIGTPWTFVIVFAVALVLARLAGRWGVVGLVLAFLVPASYVGGGVESEPITGWAYNHDLGLAAYLSAEVAAAVAVMVLAGWELWLRWRNRGQLAATPNQAT